jgi:hypothetical protein
MRLCSLTSDVCNNGLDYEYVGGNENWLLAYLHHPWLYTRAELDAFISKRCEEFEDDIMWSDGDW